MTPLSNVNTSKVGNYQVVYQASDDAGNEAVPQVRQVFVRDQSGDRLEITLGTPDAKLSGEEVAVPVTVKGFNEISSLQFSLEWDPTKIRLIKEVNNGTYGPKITEPIRQSLDELRYPTVIWASPEPLVAGVALSDRELNATVAESELIGDSGQILGVMEYTVNGVDADGLVLPVGDYQIDLRYTPPSKEGSSFSEITYKRDLSIIENNDTPIIWVGERIHFSKEDYGDSSLAAQQDRLTNNVWFTRDDKKGLYNAAEESEYNKDTSESPRGTKWAFGTLNDYEDLEYTTWYGLTYHPSNDWAWPPDMIGRPIVVHLEKDNIFFELTFTSWTEEEGGGFSYTRTTALNHVPQDNQADPSATIWNGHKTFFSRKTIRIIISLRTKIV